MFNIVYIPIYYSNNNINGLFVIRGETFDNYFDGQVFTGTNLWSGYLASNSSSGGAITSIVSGGDQGFFTTGIIQIFQNFYVETFDDYVLDSTSSLADFGTSGGIWTINGSVASTVSSGIYGYGGYLNGGKFVYPHDSRYGLGDFTAEIWVKRQAGSYADNYGRYVEKGYTDGFALARQAGANTFECSFVGSQFISNNSLSPNIWTHLCMVRSGSSGFFYISGGLDKVGSVTSSLMTNSSDLNLGISNSNESLRGVYVDDFRLWNYARTPDQITQNINNFNISGSSGLINYLKFSSDLDKVVFDLQNGLKVSGHSILNPGTTGVIQNHQLLIVDTFDPWPTGYYSGSLITGVLLGTIYSGNTTQQTGPILIQN